MASSSSSHPPKNEDDDDEAKMLGSSAGCLYVKVSMDGAPYLRKVDLKIYGSYKELSSALENMFSCFTIGNFSILKVFFSSFFQFSVFKYRSENQHTCMLKRNLHA